MYIKNLNLVRIRHQRLQTIEGRIQEEIMKLLRPEDGSDPLVAIDDVMGGSGQAAEQPAPSWILKLSEEEEPLTTSEAR